MRMDQLSVLRDLQHGPSHETARNRAVSQAASPTFLPPVTDPLPLAKTYTPFALHAALHTLSDLRPL
jgi:hypothetical protein